MKTIIFCTVLVVVNIILWIIFFVKQKKSFSPERVLSEIENEVEKMILLLHHETDNCVTLVKGAKEGLMQLRNEAKKYTDLATKELSTMARSQGIINTISNSEKKYTQQKSLGKTETINPENYTLFAENDQKEILDEVEVSKVAIDMNEKLQEEIKDTSSENSMPVITKASEQIKIEKNLRTKVLDLTDEGLQPEEIAKSLDISITEVQLIIDIFG